MRYFTNPQMKIGEIAIEDIKFDSKSRDEIPQILKGLQSIYCDEKLRKELFKILEKIIPSNIKKDKGRNGMELWKIFVLGTLRLCCNIDFDKLHELANNHIKIREMLCHSKFDNHQYSLQTIKDNILLFKPEVLDMINVLIVNHGHLIINKKDQNICASCDSFVVETNVHFPTDINLLFDCIRKILTIAMFICSKLGITKLRQGKNTLKKIKKLFIIAQKVKRGCCNDEKKKQIKDKAIKDAHIAYIDFVAKYISIVKEIIDSIVSSDLSILGAILDIEKYINHAERQIDQIRRRVIEGETIPHHEKVFSVFEEHTEWICKGKAGVPVELGLRVCIVKDQYGFILNHLVMEKKTDDSVAIQIIKDTKEKYSNLTCCSFDKGFHSPENQKELAKILDKVVLPRKGKLSAISNEIENSDEFIKIRKKHAAVESSINALENHGLDRCLDHGIHGFKRYIALSVVARNIQIIGKILNENADKKEKRKQKIIQQAA